MGSAGKEPHSGKFVLFAGALRGSGLVSMVSMGSAGKEPHSGKFVLFAGALRGSCNRSKGVKADYVVC
jgi:hypothetical protein